MLYPFFFFLQISFLSLTKSLCFCLFFHAFILSDFPCEVRFVQSVDGLVEPNHVINFTQFSLDYIKKEEIPHNNFFEPRFGGHQTLAERETSFYARNQTLHCGFVKGPPGYPSTGFELDEKDKAYMSTCKVVVSSCIFGSSDFLRRPTRRLVNELFLTDFVCLSCLYNYTHYFIGQIVNSLRSSSRRFLHMLF